MGQSGGLEILVDAVGKPRHVTDDQPREQAAGIPRQHGGRAPQAAPDGSGEALQRTRGTHSARRTVRLDARYDEPLPRREPPRGGEPLAGKEPGPGAVPRDDVHRCRESPPPAVGGQHPGPGRHDDVVPTQGEPGPARAHRHRVPGDDERQRGLGTRRRQLGDRPVTDPMQQEAAVGRDRGSEQQGDRGGDAAPPAGRRGAAAARGAPSGDSGQARGRGQAGARGPPGTARPTTQAPPDRDPAEQRRCGQPGVNAADPGDHTRTRGAMSAYFASPMPETWRSCWTSRKPP